MRVWPPTRMTSSIRPGSTPRAWARRWGGHVAGPASGVGDGVRRVLLVLAPVGGRGRSGFVDAARHHQAGGPGRVLNHLTLDVGEVGGYGNDRPGDVRAQVL